MRAISLVFKKLPKVPNRPMGKNSLGHPDDQNCFFEKVAKIILILPNTSTCRGSIFAHSDLFKTFKSSLYFVR
jgi:hypothetical protein